MSPFLDKTKEKTIEKNKKGIIEYQDVLWNGISKNARKLAELMTCPDPNNRITAEDCLKHEWIACQKAIPAADNIEKYSQLGSQHFDMERIKPSFRHPTLVPKLTKDKNEEVKGGALLEVPKNDGLKNLGSLSSNSMCSQKSIPNSIFSDSSDGIDDGIPDEVKSPLGHQNSLASVKPFSPGRYETRDLRCTPGSNTITKQSIDQSMNKGWGRGPGLKSKVTCNEPELESFDDNSLKPGLLIPSYGSSIGNSLSPMDNTMIRNEQKTINITNQMIELK